jgi:hypothetical protein
MAAMASDAMLEGCECLPLGLLRDTCDHVTDQEAQPLGSTRFQMPDKYKLDAMLRSATGSRATVVTGNCNQRNGQPTGLKHGSERPQ